VRLRRRSSLICLLLGLVTVIPVRMIVGVVVGLGGLVQMGSSVGSTNQLELSLNQTEDERNAAIDALEFFDPGDGACANSDSFRPPIPI
jgi:hypothetical protein